MNAEIVYYEVCQDGGEWTTTNAPVGIEIDGFEFAPVDSGREDIPFLDNPRVMERFARVCRAVVAAAKALPAELSDRSIPDYETIMGGGQ